VLDPLTAIVVALIAGPVVLVLTYVLAGSIRTSTADRLWKEAKDIRDQWKARADVLETRLLTLEGDLQQLREENGRLHRQVGKLEFENTRLIEKNHGLEVRITELEARNGV